MKKKLSAFLGLTALVFILLPQVASAASCKVTDKGVASLDIPTLPKTGIYTVWTRIKVPDSAHTRYNLEINGSTCFTVGSSGLTPNQWVWVSYQNDNLNDKVVYDFSSSGGNSVRLVGVDTGVKIDRLLLLQSGCVPTERGDNCKTDAALISTQNSSSSNDPSSPVTVGGKVFLSTYVSQESSNITKLVYFSDGRKVQESNGAAPLDTTLLSNGKHTVTMRITDSTGKTTDTVSYIVVANQESATSPVTRWLRLNQQSLAIAGASFGAVSMIVLIFWSARSIAIERKRMKHHGF